MPSQLKLGGVAEWIATALGLAPDLTADATMQGLARAEAAAEELRAAYPVVTGALRASVAVTQPASANPSRTALQLVATAPHAEYYEFGTVRTTAHPTFVPIARRGREAFTKGVVDRVRAEGFRVTGA